MNIYPYFPHLLHDFGKFSPKTCNLRYCSFVSFLNIGAKEGRNSKTYHY